MRRGKAMRHEDILYCDARYELHVHSVFHHLPFHFFIRANFQRGSVKYVE